MLLTCLMPELEEVLAHEVRLLRAARLHVHPVQGEPGLACRNNSSLILLQADGRPLDHDSKGLSQELDLAFEDMHGSVLGLNSETWPVFKFLGAPIIL